MSTERGQKVWAKAAAGAAGVMLLSATPTARGGTVSLTDPGLFDSNSYAALFEARARLDNGNSQTWKTAFWSPTNTATPVITSGVWNPSPWMSARAEAFTLTYDTQSGVAAWSILGRTISWTFAVSAGKEFAAFRFEARSNTGAVSLGNGFLASVNGATAEAIDGLTSVSASESQFVSGPMVYLRRGVTTLTLTGSVTFTYDGAQQGDRVRFSVRGYEATPIADQPPVPSPSGGMALASMGLLLGLRRRRG